MTRRHVPHMTWRHVPVSILKYCPRLGRMHFPQQSAGCAWMHGHNSMDDGAQQLTNRTAYRGRYGIPMCCNRFARGYVPDYLDCINC